MSPLLQLVDAGTVNATEYEPEFSYSSTTYAPLFATCTSPSVGSYVTYATLGDYNCTTGVPVP